jgi:very-short-patch-repair endonuclease
MVSDKKKVARILKGIKKKAKSPLYAAKKAKFIENQAHKMSKKMTWPEREFKKLMKELGIETLPQKIVGGKIYDFYIPSINTLIEIDGDYWHGNPEVFEEQNGMQRRAAKNDEYKNVLAKGLGYKIERIWESELKNNYNEVKQRMKKLIE